MFFSLASQGQCADSLKTQLLKDWKRSKTYTLDYLKIIPPDKCSFKPQDSIRTLAQQMIHLSQATVSLIEAATGMKIPGIINRQDLESTPSALTKDSVSYFVSLSYDYAIQALENFESERGEFEAGRFASGAEEADASAELRLAEGP